MKQLVRIILITLTVAAIIYPLSWWRMRQQVGAKAVDDAAPVSVVQAERFAVSVAVRDLPTPALNSADQDQSKVFDRREEGEDEEQRERVEQSLSNAADGVDPVIQRSAPQTDALAGPTVSFDGLSYQNNVQYLGGTFLPPDTNGDVGPNHYVQMVNVTFRVWDKQGNALTPPRLLSDLFAPLGPPAGTGIAGDPIVLYDPLADRWMLSQFFNTSPTTLLPAHEVIAISKTGDPTGEYYLYDFVTPGNKFPDYPHLGVWTDGYYMTANQFQNGSGSGVGVYAFDKQKMLMGDPKAGYIYFDTSLLNIPTVFGLLPSDIDGLRPPPPGAPNVMAALGSSITIRIFECHADFANPGASTLIEKPSIAVAPYDSRNPSGRNDIEQPVPATATISPCDAPPCYYLDSIQDRLLFRLAYRNFGTHESLTVTHTVNVSGLSGSTYLTHQAGVRYYEFRRAPGGNFGVQEQATFAPDSDNRWMGSAALDGAGNLAVGYSVSSLTTFPTIRYAARLVNDAPGGLMQGETTLQQGTGTQRNSSGRWGDYSSLSVDPTDDSTFWYTTEYLTRDSSIASTAGWLTRITAFKLPGSSAPITGTLQGRVLDCTTGRALSLALVEVSNGYSRATLANGTYSARLLPGTYTVRASAPGYPASNPQVVVVNANGTLEANFCLTPIAVVITGRTGENGESCLPQDNVINPGERLSLNLTLPNNGAAPTNNLVATLMPSNGIVAISEPQSYGVLNPGETATRSFTFTVTGGCGTALNLSFHLQDADQDLGTVSVPFGTGTTVEVFREDFESVTAPALPTGWKATLNVGSNTDSLWTTATRNPFNGRNAATVPAPATRTDNWLDSPAIALPNAPAQLSFRNKFNLADFIAINGAANDGAALEISIADGPFTDILSAGGNFISGGYNVGIPTTVTTSPLVGRRVWSGNSAGYANTVIDLPPSASGKPIRLRWRVATNTTVGGGEQMIDAISVTAQVPFTIGAPKGILAEDFDSVPAGQIPVGWDRSIALGAPTATNWNLTQSTGLDTGTQAMRITGTAVPSDVRLDSLPIAIQTATSQLTFRSNYSLEGSFDGVALEISIGGGAFTDILAAGGSFETGGYLGKVNSDSQLNGRLLWTGASGGWVTTKVNLPAAAAGKTIRLRWRFASDTGGASPGYLLDSVTVSDGYLCTDACMPVRLVERVQLSRDAATREIVANLSLTNEGGTTATNVQLSEAQLGGVAGTISAQPSVSNIVPGGVVSLTVRFPASAGAAGNRSAIRLGGTYGNGNSFGNMLRVTIP